MLTTTTSPQATDALPSPIIKTKRIESIDILRGIVMIIMAIDHVRDYFHADAFLFSPTDLNRTSIFLFSTRFITHYCAPIFVFLAGVSAYLSGQRKTKKQLSFFLLTRGIWLMLAEMSVITLLQTFNLTYPGFNLQVIWAIGVCMSVLSALIYLDKRIIITIGILLVAGHNLLDSVHVPGGNLNSFAWAILHDPGNFTFGRFTFRVVYPVLPWIGIISIGYCFGSLFKTNYDPEKRKRILVWAGLAALVLFAIVRAGNFYGDAAHWSLQRSFAFSVLSFLNVTKYPPSFQYILMTLGPALLFLAFAEKPLSKLTSKIAVFGRVAMFYYMVHILLIHLLAIIGAVILGYKWSDMILHTRVNAAPALKGYGFNLLIVYLVWMTVIAVLYPLCKWYDRFKKNNQGKYWWLSYL